MRCITSISISILLNRDAQHLIFPMRGLRQGDLLSPYLFFLCAKGLSSLLKKAEVAGSLSRIQVSWSSPIVSYFFFANKIILFAMANESKSHTIRIFYICMTELLGNI